MGFWDDLEQQAQQPAQNASVWGDLAPQDGQRTTQEAPPIREASIADNVPGLAQLERGYEAARNYMLKEPKPGERSLFGEPEILKPVSDAIRAAGNFMIPSSIPELGAGLAVGKAAEKVLPYLLSSFRAMRPLTKEIANEDIGKLLPEEALKAKQWFETYGKAPPVNPVEMAPVPASQVSKAGFANRVAANQGNTLEDFQATLETLHKDKDALFRAGRTAAAHKVEAQIADMTDTIEKAYPGFKEAQKGYAKLKDVGRLQQYTEEANPLKAFEKDLSEGRTIGPNGEDLLTGGPRATQFLKPSEVQDVKGILGKLGKEPPDSIWRAMIEGRAIGGMLGGAAGGFEGYKQGGLNGAVIGTATGIAVPRAINGVLSKAISNPVGREFLKRGLRGGTISSPTFWRAMGLAMARQGVNLWEGMDGQ